MKMISRIGKKLVQGAKAELQENPPDILNSDRMLDLVETTIGLLALMLTIFAGSRSSKPTTTVINNIYINGIKQN